MTRGKKGAVVLPWHLFCNLSYTRVMCREPQTCHSLFTSQKEKCWSTNGKDNLSLSVQTLNHSVSIIKYSFTIVYNCLYFKIFVFQIMSLWLVRTAVTPTRGHNNSKPYCQPQKTRCGQHWKGRKQQLPALKPW